MYVWTVRVTTADYPAYRVGPSCGHFGAYVPLILVDVDEPKAYVLLALLRKQ
jgi:hypothetical protein